MIFSLLCAATISQATVYGPDDRVDVVNTPDAKLRSASRAVGAMVLNEKIVPGESQESARLVERPFSKSYRLCSGVNFRDQSFGAYATGFLISDRHFVTAAHAVLNSADERIQKGDPLCRDVSVVFDYVKDSDTKSSAVVLKKNIYRCQKVIYRELEWLGADIGIIELDRPVTDRAPLRWSKAQNIEVGLPLVVVGHPHGLPMKISLNSFVREVQGNRFSNNADTSAGNSGSPILNAATLEIEGIHVSGEIDWTRTKNGCRQPKACKDDGCWGSWGYRPPLTLIQSFLK